MIEERLFEAQVIGHPVIILITVHHKIIPITVREGK